LPQGGHSPQRDVKTSFICGYLLLCVATLFENRITFLASFPSSVNHLTNFQQACMTSLFSLVLSVRIVGIKRTDQ
jgi:hypothetical protein